MSDMRDMVRQAEDFEKGAKILVQARDAWRKEGGKVVFSVYTKSGHDNCTSELTKKSVEKVFEILIGEYNDQIRDIKSQIIRVRLLRVWTL